MAMSAEQHAAMTARGGSRWLTGLELTAIGVTGALILAPYLLPALGIGNVEIAEETMAMLHSDAAGTGLAGMVARGLGAIPLVGPSLAAGGWAATATAGVIGIGGTLLGNALAKRAGTPREMRWCRVLTFAALATSSLISLPALLTGVSAGIVYLSYALSGADLASEAVTFLANTLGSVGTATVATAGAGGAIATAARLLTCCMPALPTGFLLAARKHGISHSGQPDTAATHTAEMSDSPMAMQVALSSPLVAGQPCEGRLTLHDPLTGEPMSPAHLDLRHEHKLHFMIVDDGLGDYHHVHPVPTHIPGEYRFSFTPRSSEGYHFWADAQRTGEAHGTAAHVAIASPHPAMRSVRAGSNSAAQAGGLHLRWSASPPLRQGQDSTITISITDASGKPVHDLQPIMGAAAHLVGFTAGAAEMMHVHPMDGDRPSGSLHFHLHPEREGPVTFFLQVAHGGETLTAAFGQSVFPKHERVRPRPTQNGRHMTAPFHGAARS